MTLQGKLSLLDPFTHTKQDHDKIWNFDFYKDQATEKIRIVETFCTVVTVSGKYLEKKTFKKVLKKIDEIRKIIRIKIHFIRFMIINYNYYIKSYIDNTESYINDER